MVFPIYTEALTHWALPGSRIPPSLIRHSHSFEMLRHFGYANLTIPPSYGIPEPEVQARAQKLGANENFKRLFNR